MSRIRQDTHFLAGKYNNFKGIFRDMGYVFYTSSYMDIELRHWVLSGTLKDRQKQTVPSI